MGKHFGVIEHEGGSPLSFKVLTSEEWKSHSNADDDSPNYELVKIGYDLAETQALTNAAWKRRTYFNGDGYSWEKWLSVADLQYHYKLSAYAVKKVLSAQKKNLETITDSNKTKYYRLSQVVSLFKLTPEVDFND